MNIVKGVISVYEWKDLIEENEEALLLIKSCDGKTKALTEFIEVNHPYDCPEVLTVKVSTLNLEIEALQS